MIKTEPKSDSRELGASLSRDRHVTSHVCMFSPTWHTAVLRVDGTRRLTLDGGGEGRVLCEMIGPSKNAVCEPGDTIVSPFQVLFGQRVGM